MPERRTPLWLWPNLLSLDAPIVALVWLTMFAPISGMFYRSWQAYAALGLVVWGIYVLDRIMDLKLLGTSDERLKERHQFHGRHIRWMGFVGLGALLGGAIIALTSGWPSTLIGHGYFTPDPDRQIGFIVPGLLMVGAYFVLTISSLQTDEIPHFRNLIAGLTFSYGVVMTASLNGRVLDSVIELFSLPMLSFALLCSINISAIHFWEHSRRSEDLDYKAAHEMALTMPLGLLGFISAYQALSEKVAPLRSFYVAILIATALLFLLNRNRSRLSMDALRVLADVAMIVPYPVYLTMNGS